MQSNLHRELLCLQVVSWYSNDFWLMIEQSVFFFTAAWIQFLEGPQSNIFLQILLYKAWSHTVKPETMRQIILMMFSLMLNFWLHNFPPLHLSAVICSGGSWENTQMCCLVGLRLFLANEVVSLFHSIFPSSSLFFLNCLYIGAVVWFTSICQYSFSLSRQTPKTTTSDFPYNEWWMGTVASACLQVFDYCKKSSKP